MIGIRFFHGEFSSEAGYEVEGLAQFLESVDVISINEHFFEYEGVPWVGVAVRYRELRHWARGNVGRGQGSHQGKAMDAREGQMAPKPEPEALEARLSAEEFYLYDALRKWRNSVAQAAGLASYTMFTNRQLAEVAVRQPRDIEGLRAIPGIGEGRVSRFGHELLSMLGSAMTRMAGVHVARRGAISAAAGVEQTCGECIGLPQEEDENCCESGTGEKDAE